MDHANEVERQCPAAQKLDSIVAIGQMLHSFRLAFPASQEEKHREGVDDEPRRK